jgi:hypothetical protein
MAFVQSQERGGKLVAQRYRLRTPAMAEGENQSAMDNAGSPVLSLAADAVLHKVSVNAVRRRPMKWQEAAW